MKALYNEIDQYCCAWLSNLMDAGLITPGKIDNRSITELTPDDVKGYERVHFFAGIAGWDYALNLAGWGEEPVWTGSCPCQPFSVAGKGKGTADERHLWPELFRLIRAARPNVVLGEQVAGKAGYGWLDGVRLDFKSESYACRGIDIPACGVNAPHIRQRLYWVADSECRTSERHGFKMDGAPRTLQGKACEWQRVRFDSRDGCAISRLGNANNPRSQGRGEHVGEYADQRVIGPAGKFGGVAYSQRDARESRRITDQPGESLGTPETGPCSESGRYGLPSYWGDYELLPCLDGKTRRTQPGLFPLANGVPARMGKLRAYGNAIVPQVAAEVISAYMEAREMDRELLAA